MRKVVILVLILIFFMSGCSIKKAEEVTDAEIFASEYAISKNNVFKYANVDEVISLLEEGTGIIFFGNSDQECCSSFVKLFSDLVDKEGIEEVYYYNPTVIQDDYTDEYVELINLLGDNLTITDEGDSYLTIPSVYFIRDGNIIGYNDNASLIMNVEDEKLDEFMQDLENDYLELITKYLNKENID